MGTDDWRPSVKEVADTVGGRTHGGDIFDKCEYIEVSSYHIATMISGRWALDHPGSGTARIPLTLELWTALRLVFKPPCDLFERDFGQATAVGEFVLKYRDSY